MHNMTDLTGSASEVDCVQLLDPDGARVDNDEYAFSGTDQDIVGFYRDMVITRRIDTEATALQRQGELGLWASCLGQEAAQVGAARAFGPQDQVFPTYREHGVAWCMDVDAMELLRLFRGVDLGSWDVHSTRFHLYTVVIGAQTLHATGYAMGLERDGLVGTGDPGRDAAVVGFLGDGATSQGDVSEAFVFASSYNAPVVFICQNNQWAISEPTERQSRIPLYQRSSGFGIPGVRVDGNDPLAMYAVTEQALERARSGSGPSFIEAYTYRMGAHTTSDDPSKYRLDDEVEHWRRRDPIARVRAYLTRNGLVQESYFDEIDTEAHDVATDLRRRCLAEPDPRLLDVFDHAYAEPSPLVTEEKQAYTAYLDGFAGDHDQQGQADHVEGQPAEIGGAR